MTEQTIAAFQQNLRGRLIQPADPDYDAARSLYNGMIDKRPRLIAVRGGRSHNGEYVNHPGSEVLAEHRS